MSVPISNFERPLLIADAYRPGAGWDSPGAAKPRQKLERDSQGRNDTRWHAVKVAGGKVDMRFSNWDDDGRAVYKARGARSTVSFFATSFEKAASRATELVRNQALAPQATAASVASIRVPGTGKNLGDFARDALNVVTTMPILPGGLTPKDAGFGYNNVRKAINNAAGGSALPPIGDVAKKNEVRRAADAKLDKWSRGTITSVDQLAEYKPTDRTANGLRARLDRLLGGGVDPKTSKYITGNNSIGITNYKQLMSPQARERLDNVVLQSRADLRARQEIANLKVPGQTRFEQGGADPLQGVAQSTRDSVNALQDLGNKLANSGIRVVGQLGEGMKLGVDTVKGINGAINGLPRFLGQTTDLLTGETKTDHGEVAAGAGSGAGKLFYGMGSGMVDGLARIAFPGQVRDQIAAGSQSIQTGLDQGYRGAVKKRGIDPDSVGYQVGSTATQIAGAALLPVLRSLKVPGSKTVPKAIGNDPRISLANDPGFKTVDVGSVAVKPTSRPVSGSLTTKQGPDRGAEQLALPGSRQYKVFTNDPRPEVKGKPNQLAGTQVRTVDIYAPGTQSRPELRKNAAINHGGNTPTYGAGSSRDLRPAFDRTHTIVLRDSPSDGLKRGLATVDPDHNGVAGSAYWGNVVNGGRFPSTRTPAVGSERTLTMSNAAPTLAGQSFQLSRDLGQSELGGYNTNSIGSQVADLYQQLGFQVVPEALGAADPAFRFNGADPGNLAVSRYHISADLSNGKVPPPSGFSLGGLDGTPPTVSGRAITVQSAAGAQVPVNHRLPGREEHRTVTTSSDAPLVPTTNNLNGRVGQPHPISGIPSHSELRLFGGLGVDVAVEALVFSNSSPANRLIDAGKRKLASQAAALTISTERPAPARVRTTPSATTIGGPDVRYMPTPIDANGSTPRTRTVVQASSGTPPVFPGTSAASVLTDSARKPRQSRISGIVDVVNKQRLQLWEAPRAIATGTGPKGATLGKAPPSEPVQTNSWGTAPGTAEPIFRSVGKPDWMDHVPLFTNSKPPRLELFPSLAIPEWKPSRPGPGGMGFLENSPRFNPFDNTTGKALGLVTNVVGQVGKTAIAATSKTVQVGSKIGLSLAAAGAVDMTLYGVNVTPQSDFARRQFNYLPTATSVMLSSKHFPVGVAGWIDPTPTLRQAYIGIGDPVGKGLPRIDSTGKLLRVMATSLFRPLGEAGVGVMWGGSNLGGGWYRSWSPQSVGGNPPKGHVDLTGLNYPVSVGALASQGTGQSVFIQYLNLGPLRPMSPRQIGPFNAVAEASSDPNLILKGSPVVDSSLGRVTFGGTQNATSKANVISLNSGFDPSKNLYEAFLDFAKPLPTAQYTFMGPAWMPAPDGSTGASAKAR